MPDRPSGLSRFVMVLPARCPRRGRRLLGARSMIRNCSRFRCGTPAPLTPGAVALITVRPRRISARSRARLRDGRCVLARRVRKEWDGLAGISLEAAPGAITLTIQGTTASGTTAATAQCRSSSHGIDSRRDDSRWIQRWRIHRRASSRASRRKPRRWPMRLRS